MGKIGLAGRFGASLLISLFLLGNFSLVAFGAGDEPLNPGTVLPGTDVDMPTCDYIMSQVDANQAKIEEDFKNPLDWVVGDQLATGIEVLACGIKTGRIHLWMVPYYIKYILEFIIGISGIIAVGGVIYGGFIYLFSGLMSEKDKGKKAIMYGIIGMVLSLLAWGLVNILISLFTG